VAAYQWITNAGDQDILKSIINQISDAGFEIDRGGTTAKQVSAHRSADAIDSYWVRVKLIATWKNQASGKILIELRSDEPHLKPGTNCERSALTLQKHLPPIH